MSVTAESGERDGGAEVPIVQQQPQVNMLDKGQIHTKRHSAEDPAKLVSFINSEPFVSIIIFMKIEQNCAAKVNRCSMLHALPSIRVYICNQT